MSAGTNSTARLRLRWDVRDYTDIVRVAYEPPVLVVTFANGDTVRVATTDLTPRRERPAAWERAVVDEFGGVVVPTDGEPIDFGGDLFRHLTDPAFAAHWEWANEYLQRQLGAKLAKFRREQGLTLRELSRLAGMPHQNISRLEQGKRDPAISSVRTILTALGRDWKDINTTAEEQEAFRLARWEAFPQDRLEARERIPA